MEKSQETHTWTKRDLWNALSFLRMGPVHELHVSSTNFWWDLYALVLPKVAQDPLKIVLAVPVGETRPAHGVDRQLLVAKLMAFSCI